MKHGTASRAWGWPHHTPTPTAVPDQITWIMNHAEDQARFVDLTLSLIAEKYCPGVKSAEERAIVLHRCCVHAATTLRNAVSYEEWLEVADGDYEWKRAGRERRCRHVLYRRLGDPNSGCLQPPSECSTP